MPLSPPVAALIVAFLLTNNVASAGCIGTRFNNSQPSDAAVTSLFVSNTPTHVQLNVPPRYMWGWGGTLTGYCGSMSVQSSALYFGSWISEQYCRFAANNKNTEILVGDGSAPDDFDRVAAAFGLSIVHFNNNQQSAPQVDPYLVWMQSHLVQGHPIIGCLYIKYPKDNADSSYDHIVPVVGVTMNATQQSFASGNPVTTNVSTVLFNDLWSATTRALSNPVATLRSQWLVADDDDLEQPYDYAVPAEYDFGVAVTGVRDDAKETYRTKLTAWSWTEPDWGTEDKCNEAPQLLNLSVCVYGLTAGESYTILRFDGNASVPTSNFASAPYGKRWDFVATSATYVQSPLDTIWSNTVASYRTIRTPTPTTPRPPTSAPTPSPTSTPTEAPDDDSKSHTLYILAAAIGALVVVITVLLMWVVRKRRLSKAADGYQVTGAPPADSEDNEIYAVHS